MYITARYDSRRLATVASSIPLLDRSDSPKFTDLTVKFQEYQALINAKQSSLDMGGQSKAWETLMVSCGEIYKGAGNKFFSLNEHVIANKERMSPRVIKLYLERQFAHWGITREAALAVAAIPTTEVPATPVLTFSQAAEPSASEASLEDVALESSAKRDVINTAGLSDKESEARPSLTNSFARLMEEFGPPTPPLEESTGSFAFQLPPSRYPSGSESPRRAMNTAAIADRLYALLSLPIHVLEKQASRPETPISNLSDTEPSVATVNQVNQFAAVAEPQVEIVSPIARAPSDESTDTSNVDQDTNSPASSGQESERPLSTPALSGGEAIATNKIRGLTPQQVIASARVEQNNQAPGPLLRARKLPVEGALAPLGDRMAAQAIQAAMQEPKKPIRHGLLKSLFLA